MIKEEEKRRGGEEEMGGRGDAENFLLPVIDGEVVETLPAGADAPDEELTVVSAKNTVFSPELGKADGFDWTNILMSWAKSSALSRNFLL